jgi:hypothetical protein
MADQQGSCHCARRGRNWPGYVIACTDYRPGRAEPLQRDLRASDNREQIDKLRTELEAEKIVKGWQRLVWLDEERNALKSHRMVG